MPVPMQTRRQLLLTLGAAIVAPPCASAMNNPSLVDPSGRYAIGPAYDVELSAPLVLDRGVPVGVYIDDTTPDIDAWVAAAAAKYPDGLVLVGVAMGTPRLRHRPSPPVLNMQEWYPFHSGYPLEAWGPVPHCDGYITQWNFWGFKGWRSPTFAQRSNLLARIRLKRPKLVLLY